MYRKPQFKDCLLPPQRLPPKDLECQGVALSDLQALLHGVTSWYPCASFLDVYRQFAEKMNLPTSHTDFFLIINPYTLFLPTVEALTRVLPGKDPHIYIHEFSQRKGKCPSIRSELLKANKEMVAKAFFLDGGVLSLCFSCCSLAITGWKQKRTHATWLLTSDASELERETFFRTITASVVRRIKGGTGVRLHACLFASAKGKALAEQRLGSGHLRMEHVEQPKCRRDERVSGQRLSPPVGPGWQTCPRRRS